MQDVTPQAYYASQSRITDPAAYAALFDPVPQDIAGISQSARGLVLHYFADLWRYEYPAERKAEIDTRYVPDILRRIQELEHAPLTVNRDPSKRFIGCCRDFTVLSVAMLRHAGIPARSRYGFGVYFEQDYYFDHVVVEFWNGTDWQLADMQLDPARYAFDVLNVPRDQFIVAGKAWQMCRAGKADPERFGLGSGVPVCGWWFIRGRMLLDLAGLNKVEMLCWDEWSYGHEDYAPLSDEDNALLDHLAVVSQQGDTGFAELQRLFNTDARLRLPDPFQSYSPALERIVDVHLR